MSKQLRTVFFVAFLLLLTPALASAQTGQIAGTIIEGDTGEPLPGVNVVVVGTQRGAITDADGEYRIINVQPGTYTVQASMVGFAEYSVEGVEVNIDLTTQVNFEMVEQTAELEGITVRAQEHVIQEDMSASRVDISAADIENLPVSNVDDVIGMQAGVQGLNIRGSGADQADFRVDGQSQTSGRDNTPYTGVSYTSVERVQVQSGGFNAEYGNMRSGVVNLVTKTGPRDHYIADFILRYSPASSKTFGMAPNDPDSYWMRPYLDDEVAWEGTDQWDTATQRRYPEFIGFNRLVEDNPDLTPEQAQELFLWRHRRDISIQNPDYSIDGTVGGPVPGIGQYLGDLRFMASYRQEQEEYIIPLSRSGYDEQTGRIKLTSDLSSSMTLNLQGMRAVQKGNNREFPRSGITNIRRDGSREHVSNFGAGFNYDQIGAWQGEDIFGDGRWSESDIYRSMLGLELNHMLTDNMFYEAYLTWRNSSYRTYPPRERDTTPIRTFGGMEVDEAPLGFSYTPHESMTGLRMGAHHSEFRDTSDVSEISARFALTHQAGQYNTIKTGFEFTRESMNIDYEWDDFLLNPGDNYTSYSGNPLYGGAFIQNKLEYLGMIANMGVRLDYFDANADRYVFDPYPSEFLGSNEPFFEDLLETQPAEAQITISPRLGVSFPITSESKLYFNYGHFYQQVVPENLYMVERSLITREVVRIANPEMNRPRTISYELGFEQALFDQFLVRAAGYYKDLQNQPRLISYVSRDGLIDYQTNRAENYQDVRGVEFSIFKNIGDWVQGFLNYTYQVESGGNFGFSTFYESNVTQREYERTTTEHYQSKPVPQPYARASITLLTPEDFGPETGGFRPLGDWRLNLLGRWKAGGYFTYTGESTAPQVESNVQWADFRMVDMRISKNIGGNFNAQIYADIENVFNLKNFNQSSFFGPRDFQNYMESLHLPEEAVEGWVSGYQPADESGNPIYGNDRPGEIDKDHIEPPNAQSLHYLFPRNVYFGMRLSF